MLRQLPIEYPGAIYHVMNRGDHREPIFHDDAGRLHYLEILDEICALAPGRMWPIASTDPRQN